MKSESQVRAELREFVVDNFLMGDATALLEDSESLMDTGVVDSTGMLEIVMYLEQHFELKIKDRELVPENLDSVNNLVQFVLRKQSAA